MLANGWNREFLIDGFPRNEDNLSGWKNFTCRKNLVLKLQQIKGSDPTLARQCDLALQQLQQQEKQQQERERAKAETRQGAGEEKKKKNEGEGAAEEGEDINASSGVPVCFCLYLDCPEGTLEQRLLLRGQKSQRSDDNATAIRKRMVIFKEETLPIVRYFEKQHKVRRIDASAPIDDVWRAVSALFEHLPQCAAAQ
ncbi:UNVERIFIED_CONTAM: hypothetical protein H355_016233 [Colinus virginianus]|nr:hypothetical protein H355_016233 [Colinus virginianus]